MTALLYSINPWIIYKLTLEYRKVFHVYVAPSFNPIETNPESSRPSAIHKLYTEYALWGERSGRKTIKKVTDITQRFVFAMTGLIGKPDVDGREVTQVKVDEIQKLLAKAQPEAFRPVLYLLPREPFEVRLQDVPAARRPSEKSIEWTVYPLMEGEFEVVETLLPTTLGL